MFSAPARSWDFLGLVFRYESAVAAGGVEALIDANRKETNPKNRVDETTERTWSKCATTKLYNAKTPITAADLLHA